MDLQLSTMCGRGMIADGVEAAASAQRCILLFDVFIRVNVETPICVPTTLGYARTSRQDGVSVEVLTDIDITLHDGLVGELLDTLGLHTYNSIAAWHRDQGQTRSTNS